MYPRLRTFKPSLPEHNLDGYLVTSDTNLRYLTGFPASESWGLITPKKSYYLTDPRYTEEARAGLVGTGLNVHTYRTSLLAALFKLAGRIGVRRLGYDRAHLTVAVFDRLKKAAPRGVRLVAADGLIERMRLIKDPDEVCAIRECLKIHRRALAHLARTAEPGKSEWEIFLKLEAFVRRRRAGFSFDPIVASGPNSAFPHARVTQRVLRRAEPLLIDFGIDLGGYKSDLTRMFYFDKIPTLLEEMHNHVREAQGRAIAAIRPGVSASEVDHQARNYLKRQKLAKYFTHSLGHGVGLDIHEAPRLSAHHREPLAAGMVVTVEPAVYVPGRFGIRIEDMVLVTETGGEILSR